MTTKEAAGLYQRAGKPVPADLSQTPAEHVRNTRRKVVDGIEFRSTLEADCYQLLKAWQAAGAIRNLELQPKFLLQPAFRIDHTLDFSRGHSVRAITYKADFRFQRQRIREGSVLPTETVVIEAKGFRTQAFELRRKMFLAKFPNIIYEIWTEDKLKEMN